MSPPPPLTALIDLDAQLASAGYAVLGRWRERYDDIDYVRALDTLESVGGEHLAEGGTGVEAAMRLAVDQAQRVKGSTYPNPPVGAVILDAAGDVVGTGGTEPVGGPHAEVIALRAAGERAAGGTAVITLEPCNHHGRTPPCVDALLAAGVVAVVFAVADPNPAAAGGAERLRAAGVTVIGGVCADEVAAAGYEAAEANRSICVPGAPNKAIAAIAKIVPDDWALALMASQGSRFRKV